MSLHAGKVSLCAFLLTMWAAVAAVHAAQTIPGIDIIVKKCCHVTFSGDGLSPIPGDFFGPGSLPFEGEIAMGGFDEVLLERTAPSNFDVENPSTIPTELVQLTLTSVAPFEPLPGYSYNVVIDMTGSGSLSLLETNPAVDGGGFVVDSFFDITYNIDFLPLGGTPTGPLGLNGAMVLELAAPNPSDQIPWSNLLPGGGLPLGGSNFVLGSDGSQLSEFLLQSPDGGVSLLMMTASVPEPCTLTILALGLLCLGLRRRADR